MAWSDTCAVVLPCLNEGGTVAALVAEMRRSFATIFVVDDGSTDKTAAESREAGARVLSHAKNRGKGAALKTGLSEALRGGFEWALTMDGDGQHRPQDASNFLQQAERSAARLFIGNRMQNAQAIPWLRRHVNLWMSTRLSKLAGQHFPDSQCGFRLVNLKAWAGLRLETEHYEFESELLLAFVRAGCGVEFVPIQTIANGEHSHIHPVRDTYRWLEWWRRAG